MPTKTTPAAKRKSATRIIRTLYLYMVTGISIVMILISVTMGFGLILKEYVLKVVDYELVNGPYECMDEQLFYVYDTKGVKIDKEPGLTVEQKQSKKDDCMKTAEERIAKRHINDVKTELAEMLAMLFVAVPFYLFHWGIIKKENSKD